MHTTRLLREDAGEAEASSRSHTEQGMRIRPYGESASVAGNVSFHTLASPKVASENLARSLIRVIWVSTAVWVLLPMTKTVQLACLLGVGDPLAPAARSDDGLLIARLAEWSGMLALGLSPVSTFAVGSLVALALACLLIEARSVAPRVGATIVALALYGGVALNLVEIREAMLALTPGLVGIAVSILMAMSSLILAWRWVENVALSAALLPREDPLAISPEVDAEAGSRAQRGVDAVNMSTSRLTGAFQRFVRESSMAEEPGLSGRGSPIPRRLPEDEPVSARTA